MMILNKKKPRSWLGLRIWAETHDKIKAISRHYKTSMVSLLDQIADHMIEANGIPYKDKENK